MHALSLATALAATLALAGCAALLPADAPPDPTVESRHDLVRAFHERGWATRPVAFRQPLGIVGQGTVYRVEGRTLTVFDYASPEQAAMAAPRDAIRLLRLEAGQGAQVYRRETLVVLTYGRRLGAFDMRMAALLSGPSLAPAPRRNRPPSGTYAALAPGR